MTFAIYLIVAGAAYAWMLWRAIGWYLDRIDLQRRLHHYGLEARRYESNASMRRRLLLRVSIRPACGSRQHFQWLAAKLLDIEPAEVRIEVTQPGCVLILVPRRFSDERVLRLTEEMLSEVPMTIELAIARDDP